MFCFRLASTQTRKKTLVLFWNRSQRGPVERGDENQFITISTRKRHLGSRWRQVDAHSVQGLETHPSPSSNSIARTKFAKACFHFFVANGTQTGLAGWQHENTHDRVHLAGGRQLRRDAQHPEIREPCEKHSEQAENQWGPQRCDAAGISKGDWKAQSNGSTTKDSRQSETWYTIHFIYDSCTYKFIGKIEADLERERAILRTEYEEKIHQLQRDIEKEQETNAKSAAEMENLRRAYEDELQRINNESMRKVWILFLTYFSVNNEIFYRRSSWT